MTSVKPDGLLPGRDFSLVYWNADAAKSGTKAACNSQWDWVVSSHSSPADWYLILISNLVHADAFTAEASMLSIREAIVHGLRRVAFNRLKTVLNAPGEQLSRVVGIPARTIARRAVFKPDESERILRVASAFQRSIEVLGSLAKARRWFSHPARALGDKAPFEFCDTELGAREVMNLLGRIEHGVFS